jgi:hypothetical protein
MGKVYVPGIGYVDIQDEYVEQFTEAMENAEVTEYNTDNLTPTPVYVPGYTPPTPSPTPDATGKLVTPPDDKTIITEFHDPEDVPHPDFENITTEELIEWYKDMNFAQLKEYGWWKANQKWQKDSPSMNWEDKAYIVQLNWLREGFLENVKQHTIEIPEWISDRTKAMFPILTDIRLPKNMPDKPREEVLALINGMLYAAMAGTDPPRYVMWSVESLNRAANAQRSSGRVPASTKDIESNLGALRDLRQLQSVLLGELTGFMMIPFTKPIAEKIFEFLNRRKLLGEIDDVRKAIEESDNEDSTDTSTTIPTAGGGGTSADTVDDKATEVDMLRQQLVDMQSSYDQLSEEGKMALDAALTQIEDLNTQLTSQALTNAQYMSMVSALNRTVSSLNEELADFIEDFDMSNLPLSTSLPTFDFAVPGGGSSRVNCELIIDNAFKTGNFDSVPPECRGLLNTRLRGDNSVKPRTTAEISSPRPVKRLTK